MFYCFDVYDIDRSQLLFPRERRTICQSLGILHVPVLDDFEISEETRVEVDTEKVPVSVDSLLKMAESKSKLSSKVDREGLVFKAYTTQLSFKAISNLYLLKGGE